MIRGVLIGLIVAGLVGCGAATDDDDGSKDSSVENDTVEESESTSTDINVEINVENGSGKSEDVDPLLE